MKGLVLQHLRAWNDYQGSPNRLYYWLNKYGLEVEVDFIVYGPTGFYAIEVKHVAMIHQKDLSGLKAFCTDYPEATPILLYCGNEYFLKNNVHGLPVQVFLLNLTPLQQCLPINNAQRLGD